MRLATLVRDCLYLNWALPLRCLPSLPDPLRHDLHRWRGEEWGFLSTVLFRHRGLRLVALPLVRLAHSQCNLRFLTHAPGEGPCVYIASILSPFWVAPLVRAVGRQPAGAAAFSFPRTDTPRDEPWRWRMRRGNAALEVEAHLGPPNCGRGPALGEWDETVDYFRRRPTGYASFRGALRRLETEQGAPSVWPIRVRVLQSSLMSQLVPTLDDEEWPEVHSAWICPEIPIDFQLKSGRLPAVRRRAPATG